MTWMIVLLHLLVAGSGKPAERVKSSSRDVSGSIPVMHKRGEGLHRRNAPTLGFRSALSSAHGPGFGDAAGNLLTCAFSACAQFVLCQREC